MILEPLPQPDVVEHRIPDPFRPGDQLVMIAVYSDRDISEAGGKVVCEHGPNLVRVASNYQHMEGFPFRGIILDGYGDIPSGKPFWITAAGPSVARTA